MEKLIKRLEKVNKELEICRNKRISNYGKNANYFKSQAYWRLERKWDYLAMEKYELENKIKLLLNL
jgi:hypothetical protein